jgi:hypothetical protein
LKIADDHTGRRVIVSKLIDLTLTELLQVQLSQIGARKTKVN